MRVYTQNKKWVTLTHNKEPLQNIQANFSRGLSGESRRISEGLFKIWSIGSFLSDKMGLFLFCVWGMRKDIHHLPPKYIKNKNPTTLEASIISSQFEDLKTQQAEWQLSVWRRRNQFSWKLNQKCGLRQKLYRLIQGVGQEGHGHPDWVRKPARG